MTKIIRIFITNVLEKCIGQMYIPEAVVAAVVVPARVVVAGAVAPVVVPYYNKHNININVNNNINTKHEKLLLHKNGSIRVYLWIDRKIFYSVFE